MLTLEMLEQRDAPGGLPDFYAAGLELAALAGSGGGGSVLCTRYWGEPIPQRDFYLANVFARWHATDNKWSYLSAGWNRNACDSDPHGRQVGIYSLAGGSFTELAVAQVPTMPDESGGEFATNAPAGDDAEVWGMEAAQLEFYDSIRMPRPTPGVTSIWAGHMPYGCRDNHDGLFVRLFMPVRLSVGESAEYQLRFRVYDPDFNNFVPISWPVQTTVGPRETRLTTLDALVPLPYVYENPAESGNWGLRARAVAIDPYAVLPDRTYEIWTSCPV